MRIERAAAALAFCTLLALGGPIHAQGYPTRPITIIVNSEAGGPTDFTARTMKDVMQEKLGQTIVIENRTGAVGITGAAAAARAEADGHTILMSGAGPVMIVPIINKTLSYSPERDFETVTLCVEAEAFFVVNPSVARTLSEFVERAKREPGKLSYGSAGIAGPAHLASEYLKQLSQIDLLHVPYRGAPQAVTDVLSGQISMYVSALPPVRSHIETGMLNALAMIGSQRSRQLPDIKTTAEYGYPDLAIPSFFGMLVPKGTPRAVVDKINDAAQAALKDPKVQQQFEKASYLVKALGPDQFRTFLAELSARWSKIVKDADIKVQ